jgi:predicted amidohydrolase
MSTKVPYTVSTVLLQVSGETWTGTDRSRLKVLRTILEQSETTEVLLLPGGFFSSYRKSEEYLEWVEANVTPLVQELAPNSIVVFGIDVKSGPEVNRHELAVAVSKKGIKAVGRKFHGSSELKLASTPWERESGYKRIFTKNSRKFYLSICYDSFGIRQKEIENKEGVDVVLNTIHYFNKIGGGSSGNTYFARHGLAGAAMRWRCPVFGAAHFLNRPIPEEWPSGVKWKKGLAETTSTWRYENNGLKRSKTYTSKDGGFQLNYFYL